jgi:hypothetical protein
MPIAKDDGARTASTTATTVDRDIIAAAAGARGGGVLGIRPDPVRELIAAAVGSEDRPNFNPAAILDTSRVAEAPPLVGPWAPPQGAGREPGDFDKLLSFTPRRPEPEEKPGPKIVPQGDHLRGPDHPRNRSDHNNPAARNTFGPKRDELLERAKSERKAKLVDKVTQTPSIDRGIVDELAMKAGALTTVEGVSDAADMPTEADAYADALDAARAEAREQGLTGTAIDVYAGQRAPQLMEDVEAEAEGDAATAMFKAGIRATRRGVNSGGSFEKQRAMTAAEFAALSPRQKAAVELTSLLAAASERDQAIPRAQRDVTEDYRASVEKLFTGEGVEASRKNFAPNTVAVLEDIGWKGTATDLDDVLSGKLGFTRQDLRDLERPENKGGEDTRLNTAAKLRDDLQSSLVKAFAASRKEAVPGQNLLGAKRELLDYDELPGFSTGPSREVAPGVDLNTYMRKAFDILADSNSQYEPQQVLDQAKVTLSDEEFQSFLNFVDINSRESKNYRQPLGNTEGQTYFDPVEFRQSIAKELREERGRARSR